MKMTQESHSFRNGSRRVVVTGIGIVSPVGLTREATWKNLLAGKSGIDRISAFDAEGLPDSHRRRGDRLRRDGLRGPQGSPADGQVSCSSASARFPWRRPSTPAWRLTVATPNEQRSSSASGIGGIITLSEQIGVMDARGASRVSPFLVPMMLPDMASGQISMVLGAKGPNFSTVSRLFERRRCYWRRL